MASDQDPERGRGDGLVNDERPPAQTRQVGGDHYVKRKIQPWDIFEAYPDMDPFIAHIIPYLLRWRDKGGLADLKKARHTLDRLIEIQEKKVDDFLKGSGA